jgi:hypothetical protein
MGTVMVLAMYIIAAFYPELYPLNVVLGMGGGVLYAAWALRVRNWAQFTVNTVAICICAIGLIKLYF